MAEKEKDLLRDLIDQSLLTQRAKDNGINVDTEVIKRLDAIRQQYKLPDPGSAGNGSHQERPGL